MSKCIFLVFCVAATFQLCSSAISPDRPVTSRDIKQECCRQKWSFCCQLYRWNISDEDAATPPPIARSVKKKHCRLSKVKREQSQAATCLVQLGILTETHKQYHVINQLHLCVESVKKANKDIMFELVTKWNNKMLGDAIRCCTSHFKNNHTEKAKEIVMKLQEYNKTKHFYDSLNRPQCSDQGHAFTIMRKYSSALHKYGQQMRGMECLEQLGSHRDGMCMDKCVREKTVNSCVNQWLQH